MHIKFVILLWMINQRARYFVIYSIELRERDYLLLNLWFSRKCIVWNCQKIEQLQQTLHRSNFCRPLQIGWSDDQERNPRPKVSIHSHAFYSDCHIWYQWRLLFVKLTSCGRTVQPKHFI